MLSKSNRTNNWIWSDCEPVIVTVRFFQKIEVQNEPDSTVKNWVVFKELDGFYIVRRFSDLGEKIR